MGPTGTREQESGENYIMSDLYSSPIIFWVIKRRMRWAGHVAGMGERRGAERFWLGHRRVRGHLEDADVDGRVILRQIFRKWDRGMDWIDLAQDRDRWWVLVNAVMNLRVP